MDVAQVLTSVPFYEWVILPFLIFFARIGDVTLGTIRIILVNRGKRNIAPLLGFFEVLIWIVAISQIVQHLHSITSYIGYGAGFAAGNYIGMWVENRLAIGTVMVRVIVPEHGLEMIQRLHDAGYGVTCIDGQGATGPVKMIYTIVPRKNLRDVREIIHGVMPKAFLSIEDVRSTEEGVFPTRNLEPQGAFLGRKSK